MPTVRVPKLCRHKATGQAYVTLPGTRRGSLTNVSILMLADMPAVFVGIHNPNY
jgi:hypothetical protein